MAKGNENKITPINAKVDVKEKETPVVEDVASVDDATEEMDLDQMVEMKKMLDRRIREIMKNKLTCERAFINHARKTSKRGERWKVKFKSIVNGDPTSQERVITLYTTNNRDDLIKGLSDVIRMLNGLKEELEEEKEKEEKKKDTKPAPKPEPKADKEVKTEKKGGNKK